jgi:hypothetical protein
MLNAAPEAAAGYACHDYALDGGNYTQFALGFFVNGMRELEEK